MAWTITFENRKNETCVVSISGGTGTLTPAAEPFCVQMDDDDDIFKPVRTSSGNIKIVGASISTIKSIMCSTPLERSVTLTVTTASGTTTTAWMGFVKCEAFEQTLFGYNEEFSIPIMDCLSALEGVYVNDVTVKKLSAIINDMFSALNIDDVSLSFPSGTSSYLDAEVSLTNYVDYRSLEDCVFDTTPTVVCDGKPYLTVLEDICKLYGWTVSEYGSVFYFTEADKVKSTQQSIKGLDFVGTDHTVSTIFGKGSVSVSANLNKPNATGISIEDVANASVHGTGFEQIITRRDDKYIYVEAAKIDYGNIPYFKTVGYKPASSYNTIEAHNHNNHGSQGYGCFFEDEGEMSGAIATPIYESNISPCVIMCRDPNSDIYSGNNIPYYVHMYCPSPVHNTCAQYTKFSFNIETRNDVGQAWESKDAYVYVRFDSGWEVVFCPNGKYTGYSTTRSIGASVGVLAKNQHAGTWDYARITNMKIELCTNYTVLDNSKNSYIAKKTIGGGFTEDYNIDCGLTTKRNMAYGRGVITGCPVVTPEKLLCDRAFNYYKQSRNRLCIFINESTFKSPATSYTFEGTTYNIIAQDLNARDCELKLTLQEAI